MPPTATDQYPPSLPPLHILGAIFDPLWCESRARNANMPWVTVEVFVTLQGRNQLGIQGLLAHLELDGMAHEVTDAGLSDGPMFNN